MQTRYLIRLDDACPFMDSKKWLRVEDILDRYGVKPLVGIIPSNEDSETIIDSEDKDFWKKAQGWKDKGWTLALHGYNHVCTSDMGLKGLNPMWKRSEFAGLPLDIQKNKIKNGLNIFKEHNLYPNFFFAPSHTYDANTLKALEEESNIRIVSDTISTFPYKSGNFSFIPQLGGHCIEMPLPGIWTFCFHPTVMKEVDFEALELFLKKHQEEFISFSDIDLSDLTNKSLFGRLLSFIYFLSRRIKGLK